MSCLTTVFMPRNVPLGKPSVTLEDFAHAMSCRCGVFQFTSEKMRWSKALISTLPLTPEMRSIEVYCQPRTSEYPLHS